MVGFVQAVREGIRATQCGLLGFDEFVLGGVGRFSPGLRDVGLRTVNAYRRLLGCPEDGDPQQPLADFEGGQCAGVGYTVVARGVGSQGVVADSVRSGIGPVIGLCFGENVFGFRAVGVQFGGSGCVSSGVGVGSTEVGNEGTYSIVSVTRQDGLPDDCGDPPPVYPPPINFNTDIDITYEGDDGNEITVTIPFVFAPITANFDGTLRIPFSFDFGGFEFSGDVNLLPDLEVNINPPSVPRAPDINPDDFEPREGEEVEPLPLKEKIIGVVVNVVNADGRRVSQIFSPNIPRVLAPRAGLVKFAYSFGGVTFWSSDIDIKSDRTFIQCPFSQGADAVVASPETGVELTFVPIRGFPLATTQDLARPD